MRAGSIRTSKATSTPPPAASERRTGSRPKSLPKAAEERGRPEPGEVAQPAPRLVFEAMEQRAAGARQGRGAHAADREVFPHVPLEVVVAQRFETDLSAVRARLCARRQKGANPDAVGDAARRDPKSSERRAPSRRVQRPGASSSREGDSESRAKRGRPARRAASSSMGPKREATAAATPSMASGPGGPSFSSSTSALPQPASPGAHRITPRRRPRWRIHHRDTEAALDPVGAWG